MTPVAPPADLLDDIVGIADTLLRLERAYALAQSDKTASIMAGIDPTYVRVTRDLVAAFAQLNHTLELKEVAA